MTVSFHKFGDYFPGTGHLDDVGHPGAGKYHSLNIPLHDGIDDESYEHLFKPILAKVMQNYQPSAIVFQSGADSLSGDRLGCFNLSIKGHGECLKYMQGFGVPLLVLGGGGYTIRNVARCWAYETGLLLNQKLEDKLPENPYYEYYGPDHRLHIQPSNMENQNSKEYLDKVRNRLLENLDKLHPPSVQMQHVPPDAVDKDTIKDEEEMEDPDKRPHVKGNPEGHEHDSDFEMDTQHERNEHNYGPEGRRTPPTYLSTNPAPSDQDLASPIPIPVSHDPSPEREGHNHAAANAVIKQEEPAPHSSLPPAATDSAQGAEPASAGPAGPTVTSTPEAGTRDSYDLKPEVKHEGHQAAAPTTQSAPPPPSSNSFPDSVPPPDAAAPSNGADGAVAPNNGPYRTAPEIPGAMVVDAPGLACSSGPIASADGYGQGYMPSPPIEHPVPPEGGEASAPSSVPPSAPPAVESDPAESPMQVPPAAADQSAAAGWDPASEIAPQQEFGAGEGEAVTGGADGEGKMNAMDTGRDVDGGDVGAAGDAADEQPLSADDAGHDDAEDPMHMDSHAAGEDGSPQEVENEGMAVDNPDDDGNNGPADME
eukprot:CAMPEP_0197856388 /NCGR_PEP_ID=MMETSP1438-20131217/28460_1 /TAXON_ID=1461541 /ORGANISM="Pterosperma sp., Strain CCMP1384" /LENGTH=593 /DNA_ID=CAMNT_0043471829 /DNA_START=27 /DNA_END=1808 /DNA_ORIENTATION=-